MRHSLVTTMKIFFAGLAAFAVCSVGSLQANGQTQPSPQTQATAQPAATDSGRKPVLVELFTAEGCSTCPPAEAMALKMEQQVLPGADVIVLEEHVDYWNQYGWIDPFSSGEWTERQRDYVSKLADKSPYTPEMVVDGQTQFVGNNGREAQASIEKAVHEPETNITVTEGKQDPKDSGDFEVSVGQLEGNTARDTAEVWLAVTEDGLHSSVTRGENAGHVLNHAAVLRSLRKIGVAQAKGGNASFAGEARVKFKSDWKRENLRVVVFVQEKKSRKILGAASAKVAG
ncbi:MAG: DUF1223 domain-containing protein [Candidatus Acidiferrales bacterium]